MKKMLLLFVMLSSNAFACWNMKGVIEVGNEKLLIDQKINHDQTYSFSKGPYIVHVKVPSKKNWPTDIRGHHGELIDVTVVERQKASMKDAGHAMILVAEGREASMTTGKTDGTETIKLRMSLNSI